MIESKDQQCEDKEVITAIKSQDKQASNRAASCLYRFKNMIMKLVLNNNGSVEDANDLFSNTTIEFLEEIKLGKFRNNSILSTYFYGIARNTWLKELKKRGKMKIVDFDKELSTIEMKESYNQKLSREKDLELVEQCLLELPGNHADILRAFYYEKMKMKEIANRFQLKNLNVAKAKKFRALGMLRDLVTKKKMKNG